MKYTLTILSCLLLAGVAAAQDEFFFVDSATGVTNGPYDIHDHGTFRLAGHDYTSRRDTTRFDFESALIPSVDFDGVSARQAIDTILVDGIFASNRVPRVEIFKESMVTNGITFSAFSINVGETIDILAELADLEIVRDRQSQTIILMPFGIIA